MTAERKSLAERGKRLRFCNPKGIVPFGPGLRGTSYPGLLPRGFSTPTGLCQISAIEPQPRWGFLPFAEISQGSSFFATLGFVPESRWDSALEFPKGITPSPDCLCDPIASFFSKT